jgi:hypothetical protein
MSPNAQKEEKRDVHPLSRELPSSWISLACSKNMSFLPLANHKTSTLLENSALYLSIFLGISNEYHGQSSRS